MRWLIFFLSWYFTPKSSTTRFKHICRHLCLHHSGVSLLSSYPCFSYRSFKKIVPVVLLAEVHTFLFLFLCIPTHPLLIFHLVHILWWYHMENCSVSAKFIHILLAVCSGLKNWYLASIILLPGLRLRYWVIIWLWVNIPCMFRNRRDIWFCTRRLLILLYFTRVFLLLRHKLPCCRLII